MTHSTHTREIIIGAGRDPDRVPELTHYRDDGCRLHPACLTCPFPECARYAAAGARHLVNEPRDAAIRRAYADGEPARAIAARFGITARQVCRLARASRKGAEVQDRP